MNKLITSSACFEKSDQTLLLWMGLHKQSVKKHKSKPEDRKIFEQAPHSNL